MVFEAIRLTSVSVGMSYSITVTSFSISIGMQTVGATIIIGMYFSERISFASRKALEAVGIRSN